MSTNHTSSAAGSTHLDRVFQALDSFKPDAAVLDTSRLGVEAAFAEALRIVEARRGSGDGRKTV